jgi:multicomponent Na+:H+ antiporter subunit E
MMTRRLVLGAWLTLVWMALWGDLRLGNLLAGLVVAALVIAVFPPDRSPWIVLRPLAALRYAGHFLAGLVRASARLVAVVLRPGPEPTGGIITVDITATAPGPVTLVSNTVSLTPGSLVLATRPSEAGTRLYVHLLDVRREDEERQAVLHLDRLARRAFDPERGR